MYLYLVKLGSYLIVRATSDKQTGTYAVTLTNGDLLQEITASSVVYVGVITVTHIGEPSSEPEVYPTGDRLAYVGDSVYAEDGVNIFIKAKQIITPEYFNSGLDIVWSYNGNEIVFGDETTLVMKYGENLIAARSTNYPSVVMILPRLTNESEIVIIDAMEEDNGKYSLEVSNRGVKVEAESDVKIAQPIIPTTPTTPTPTTPTTPTPTPDGRIIIIDTG
ncbi:hypothetical protein, partial [Salmonella sp. s51228]|uniref:hypothetical protein n=1 Tax=Salmonella sp. s51228 TaxID=3159652 RepID=UPI00398027C9